MRCLHHAARTTIACLIALGLGSGLARAEDTCDGLDESTRAQIQRVHTPHEPTTIVLLDCAGEPTLDAIRAVSLVARAHDLDRPSDDEVASFMREHPEADQVAPGVQRLHSELLKRLARVVRRFPGHELTIVSGHRPAARRGSRHRLGHALDVRVEGVDRVDVAAFARTMPATGVGYYPNSTFTHIDYREQSAYWVDRSGPGERPQYGPFPPTDQEILAYRRELALAVERGEAVFIAPPANHADQASDDDTHGGSDVVAETPSVPRAPRTARAPAPARPNLLAQDTAVVRGSVEAIASEDSRATVDGRTRARLQAVRSRIRSELFGNTTTPVRETVDATGSEGRDDTVAAMVEAELAESPRESPEVSTSSHGDCHGAALVIRREPIPAAQGSDEIDWSIPWWTASR